MRMLRRWLSWWHITGLAGLIYGLGSIALVLSPAREFLRVRFRVSDLAGFFDERASATLAASYMEALLAGVFLLVFASGLRSYLSRAEGGYSMWSHLVLAAAGVAAAVTLTMQPFAQALALAGSADLGEPILEAAIWFSELTRTAVAIPIATLVISASIIDVRTRVFGGAAGVMGLIAAIASIVGAGWPITGSTFGMLGFLLVFGQYLTFAWFVVVGLKLVVVAKPPLHIPGEGLFDPAPLIEGWRNGRRK